MYIRPTKTRSLDSGEIYYSYRVFDAYRFAGGVCQRILLDLGSLFDTHYS